MGTQLQARFVSLSSALSGPSTHLSGGTHLAKIGFDTKIRLLNLDPMSGDAPSGDNYQEAPLASTWREDLQGDFSSAAIAGIERALSAGKSIRFAKPMDLGGYSEQLHTLRQMVVLPLARPELYRRLHITPPRGVILHGPPGNEDDTPAVLTAESLSRNLQKISRGALCPARQPNFDPGHPFPHRDWQDHAGKNHRSRFKCHGFRGEWRGDFLGVHWRH